MGVSIIRNSIMIKNTGDRERGPGFGREAEGGSPKADVDLQLGVSLPAKVGVRKTLLIW